MDLPPDWSEFFRLLTSRRVRFLIVGAHALAAHGRPRATADLDVLVEPSKRNARALCAALRDFGFDALAEQEEAFATPDRMAVLGAPPLRIDVMTSITGVTFDEAWRGRLRGKMGPYTVSFLGREALMKNKRASGRPKDLVDLEALRLGETPPPSPPSRKRSRSTARKTASK
jgi:hypothetical protein